MTFDVVAASLLLLALAILLLSLRLLLKGSWLLGWLRGMAGLSLAALAAMGVLAAIDLHGYRQGANEQTIANISFRKLGAQRFSVSLADPQGEEQRFELNGDAWQLDARILRWSPGLSRLGLKSGYRLDSLGGRYYSLEDEQSAEPTLFELGDSDSRFDVWAQIERYGFPFGLISASYGSATYLPMQDGAIFGIQLSESGLDAVPVNATAQEVMAQ